MRFSSTELNVKNIFSFLYTKKRTRQKSVQILYTKKFFILKSVQVVYTKKVVRKKSVQKFYVLREALIASIKFNFTASAFQYAIIVSNAEGFRN